MGCEFIDKLVKYAADPEVLVYKRQVSNTIRELLAFQPPDSSAGAAGSAAAAVDPLEFVSNYQVRAVPRPRLSHAVTNAVDRSSVSTNRKAYSHPFIYTESWGSASSDP